MRLFLIDTENVKETGHIFKKENIKMNDDVIFFFPTKRARKLSLAEKNALKGVPYESKIINTKNEPNSLDLAISTYAGIKLNDYDNVIIIGDDKGYNIFNERLHKELDKSITIYRTKN